MEKDQSALIQEVRSNIAFEHVLSAVLTGAGLAAGLTFVFGFARVLFGGGLSPGVVLLLIINTLTVGFLFFLIGFLAGVVVVIPLYRAFERAKRRHVWPYVVAGLAVAIGALFAAAKIAGRAGPDLFIALPVAAASLAAALDFGRRMRPVWRAAERAELEETSNIRFLQ